MIMTNFKQIKKSLFIAKLSQDPSCYLGLDSVINQHRNAHLLL